MSREVTLTNVLHNTEARVRPVPITSGRFAGLHKISRRTALRLKATPCPSHGRQADDRVKV